MSIKKWEGWGESYGFKERLEYNLKKNFFCKSFLENLVMAKKCKGKKKRGK